LWLSDLDDFDKSWKEMSDIRLADSVSIAKSEVVKKRKPVVKK